MTRQEHIDGLTKHVNRIDHIDWRITCGCGDTYSFTSVHDFYDDGFRVHDWRGDGVPVPCCGNCMAGYEPLEDSE